MSAAARFAGVRETAGVLGGGSLTVSDYADFLREQYLTGYLPGGGAAVKVAVAGSIDTAARLQRAVGAAADATGCLFVAVSAQDVRLDQVDQLLFAVTRQIDWDALSAALVRTAYDAVNMPAQSGLPVAEVAASYELDPRELYRSVRRALEDRLLRNPLLARELGRAVFRLTQAQLGSNDVDRAERDAVLGWLRGQKVPAAALKPAPDLRADRPAQRPAPADVAVPTAAPGRVRRPRALPGRRPAGRGQAAAGRAARRVVLLQSRGPGRLRGAATAHRRHR